MGSATEVLLSPALFTRMSSLPKRAMVVWTTWRQSSSLVTSVRTNRASPPAAVISAARRVPSSSRRSAMTTLAPSRANNRASSAPMPCAAPLMMATLPATRILSPCTCGRVSPAVPASPPRLVSHSPFTGWGLLWASPGHVSSVGRMPQQGRRGSDR